METIRMQRYELIAVFNCCSGNNEINVFDRKKSKASNLFGRGFFFDYYNQKTHHY